MTHPPMIVFTDLDGTLLDHGSYDHAAAQPALDRLRKLGIPVVLASSKTAAEIAPLRDKLGFAHCPAIVENGAGLLPIGEATVAGDDYTRIRATLDTLPPDLRGPFLGFGDMGPEGVAEATGLSPDQAALAVARQFSEPGLWLGDAPAGAAFIRALADNGVSAREGGRFLTLSLGRTKADQMGAILQGLHGAFSVALGDAPNDVEMLEAADLGIIVANPHRPPLPQLQGEMQGHIIRTTLAGPQGWNAAMLDLLDRRGL